MAGGRRTLVRAVSGPLALHISSGNVPGVGATSIVRSLLVKAPVVVKPGAGDVVLPVAFRDALVEIDPELAASVGVTYWPGGSAEGEDDLVMAADPVVVYGGLETIRRVRAKVPAQHRIVEYRHRFGVGVVGREALADPEEGAMAARVVAIAVAMFDQRGCVSPRVVFVEEGGGVSPLAWAGQLGEALEAVEATLPQGRPTAEEASAVHQLRGAAEARAHAGGLAGGGAGGGAGEHARRGVSVLTGSGELGWTLIVDPGATPDGPAGNRTVLIVPVEDATRVPDHLRPFGGALQTVGVRGLGSRAVRIASELGAIGASRIVPFEDAPWPPATWRHDGGDPLRELVRWVEYSPGS